MPEGNGEKWDDHSLGQVEGIMVYHNSIAVRSLGFLCVKDNINQMSEQHGKCVGKCEMIILDHPTEFLIGVYGFYYTSSSNTHVIRCISFETNKATYGPFGGSPSSTAESAFSLQLWGKESNRITAFFGFFCVKDNINLMSERHGYSVGKCEMDNINLMSEQHGKCAGKCEMASVWFFVFSLSDLPICVVYVFAVDGVFEICFCFAMLILLDYPTELLTGLYGFYDNSSCNTIIRCITFVTNKATYGPFCGSRSSSAGNAFSFQLRGKESNCMTGFYGTVYNGNLGSLGVYIQKSMVRPLVMKSNGNEV
nr:jacalin-related lectin 3-like [Ipomoea trifida]